jgi:hypothetical protein
MVKVVSFFAAVIITMGSPASSFAQGGTVGAFLRLGIGARAKAMGDAYTALARGI